ncbi:MAG: GntR family transcriptional regulator [Acidobacteria bacterium]|nr:GntR family transcriptional regulator [Acidobacteriota bacterium]
MKKRSLPKQSAQTRVADAVRSAIFAGDLRPGDPIRELHLAEQHEVSQTTVREALVRLEHAGLVRRVSNIGTFVTQLSPREIQQRLRLRVMLEGLAGAEAARLASARQIAEFDEHLEAMQRARVANDHFEAAQADVEFHRLLWTCSGDQTLCQVLDQISVPLFAFVSMERQRMQESLPDAVERHLPIVRALRARNGTAVQEAIRMHIEGTYGEYLGTALPYGVMAG